MILKRLVEFAERQPDMLPSGYQPRAVTKIIELRLDGTLRQVHSNGPVKRGARMVWERIEPQEAPARTVAIRARLFADNGNYVLGVAKEKDDPQKVVVRHKAWCDLVLQCAEEISLSEVQAVKIWMQSGGPEALKSNPEITAEDDFTFEVAGVFVTELPEVRRFWSSQGEEGQISRCLVTGQLGPVLDRMPAPIKGIPEGQMSGTALVSVNNKAFESYGLEAALNSPISKDAGEKISSALNQLLNESTPVKTEDGKEYRKHKYSYRAGKTVFISWTKEAQEFGFFDFLREPDPAHVQRLLHSPHKGGEPGPLDAWPDEEEFYVLCLSASAARIVVREAFESTLGEAKQRLKNWFEALDLTGENGKPLRPPSIKWLAESLYRDPKDVPAHVPIWLISAALSGRPLPDALLGLAVKRNLAMQGPFHEHKGKRDICANRLILLKALIQQKEKIPLSSLNTAHPDPAYHCGRLLSVLEQIQRQALGDVNATLVDRYYGAACASPGSILGGLVNDAQSHLSKLRRSSGDGWAQNRLSDVLEAVGNDFPKTLSLHRQGLFALGYYHQRAHDKAAAIEAKAAKQAQTNENQP